MMYDLHDKLAKGNYCFETHMNFFPSAENCGTEKHIISLFLGAELKEQAGEPRRVSDKELIHWLQTL